MGLEVGNIPDYRRRGLSKMDIESEILYLGIIIGWLFTVLSITIVGAVNDMDEIILLIMIGSSAGVIFGLFLIAMIVAFFQNFKVVRRD